MIKIFFNFILAFGEMLRFLSLPQKKRKIVFYAEDKHSMLHFEPIIKQLAFIHEETLCYLTSASDDVILETHHNNIIPVYVGDGVVRTLVFSYMAADLLIMTMPDLETYHIKRSKRYPVHYLYLFHGLVSTHYIYRKAAFDSFDTIFCTGPHQIEEIKATEKLYNLKQKNLVKDGYRPLESLMAEVKEYRKVNKNTNAKKRPMTVVVAPSWGKNAILETCGLEIVQNLLDSGFRTIVRPHPLTTKYNGWIIKSLSSRFSKNELFHLNQNLSDKSSLFQSHVMISDWSSIAIEYAFACERPVIFIDVPMKCNNPEADRINIIPLELIIREKIGRVILPDQLDTISEAIEGIYNDYNEFINIIRKLREECVYNLGSSLDGAVNQIMNLSTELQKNNSQKI